MTAAFLRLAARAEGLGVRVLLALSAEEEIGSKGTERLVPELARLALSPSAVIVGEPTGLDVATAQKGLLVLELVAAGQACHAANGRSLGAANALRTLARDLVALDGVDLGPEHPRLGPVTLEPTMASGARHATWCRDSRAASWTCGATRSRRRRKSWRGCAPRCRRAEGRELAAAPCRDREDHPLVRAALAARPVARTFGSRGLSDLVFFRGIPGIKVGPGRTERSHTPDEYVLESEILEGGRFYEDAVLGCRSFLGEGRAA